MRKIKLIVFFILINILSAHALGGYFSAKINGRDYHLFLGDTTSYMYHPGSAETYILKNETTLGMVRTFEVFITSQMKEAVGHVKISENKIDTFQLDKKKANNIKLKRLKIPVEKIEIAKQIYNNDKCSFKFYDLQAVNDIYLYKEISYLMSEIMDVFKELNCDYLKSNKSSEMAPGLNQLVCENETVILHDRFYGVSFFCTATPANNKDFKYQVFSVIYDKELKARASKADFTVSDISNEDDSHDLNFRLSPVGLGLYSTDLLENKEEHLRIIPYIGLRKNFSVWGKPKRYLSNFSIK